jgi:hypothetical protein
LSVRLLEVQVQGVCKAVLLLLLLLLLLPAGCAPLRMKGAKQG